MDEKGVNEFIEYMSEIYEFI